MRIVTYNVNGLRPRIAQYGSLLKLLDSLDADIICFQETKLSKQDLRADLVRAEGYESFFSCTRTYDKGRAAGYSGVATFCRVKSAFSSDEVALPLAAEEGFTGLLANSQGLGYGKEYCPLVVEGLLDFSREELLKTDCEGRCIITDHGHFVLFNLYGPRAESDDTERIQFKHKFFQILQKRWEYLLHQGQRVIVVGDLNIAPAAIDRCDAGPDFEKNEFRRWFRSLLVENGGNFFDVFRAKHPDRREAYTCWSTSSGAEEFNFGSRIDHILSAGSCLHREKNEESHSFISCHVKECDILLQFKRWRPGSMPRWKGGRNVKLEGSDHAPVFMTLVEIPNVLQHSTPALSTRYYPQLYGCQQTLVSMLVKRQTSEQVKVGANSFTQENVNVQKCSLLFKSQQDACGTSSSTMTSEDSLSRQDQSSQGSVDENSNRTLPGLRDNDKSVPRDKRKKKAKQSQGHQLSLKSFFQRSSERSETFDGASAETNISQIGASATFASDGDFGHDAGSHSPKDWELGEIVSVQDGNGIDAFDPCGKDKRNVVLKEWQRIQQLMQNSVPLCKGHKEPCVSRVVKKAGPNLGRRFYVCARAEGPASNPEANCGYFKWAASNSKHKR